MNQPETLHPGYVVATQRPRNLKPGDNALFQEYFTLTVPPTTLQRVRYAQILKDTIFSFKPLRFYTENTHVLPVKRSTLFKRLFRLLYPTRRLERGIWIADEWTQEYYHWYVDGLCRLEATAALVGKQVPVILPDYYAERPYVVESLQMLGYQPFYYGRKERIVVKELLVPGHTSPMALINRDLFRGLRDQLAIQPTQPPHRKVYISRANARVRRILNEDAVQRIMLQHGFEIHYMEKYSLSQQIALMAETRVIAGLHGAGFTNMLFMPEGGQLLELRNAGETSFNCFYNMASDLGHHYYYTTNKGDRSYTYDVNIEADLDALERVLDEMG